jgi:hypothetical protein
MRVLTLLARYGTAKYTHAVQDVQTLFARQMPEMDHDLLVVDNALPMDHFERAGEIEIIGGDNTAWEFSAWDRAIAYIGGRLEEYDYVHLATSAFRQLYVAYLDRFDTDMLGLARGRAVAIGHLDYSNKPVTVAGRAGQCWLRSSFLFLPPRELGLLGSVVSLPNGHEFFSGNPAAPFRAGAPISETYQQNILGWLTGTGTGQGMTWHSRFALSLDTLPFFEQKTLAILNEQLLTFRLRTIGCQIVDATWLATLADGQLGDRILRTIPDWRVQLTQRDTDAAVVTSLPLGTSGR